MYCTRCGREISDDAVFCPFCGHKITEQEIRASKAPSTPKKQSEKKFQILR